MRHRERSSPGTLVNTKGTGWVTASSCANPLGKILWPAYDVYGSYVDNSWVETCDDTLIPNFEKRRDAGEIFCNPFIRTYTQTVKTPILYENTYVRSTTITCNRVPTYALSGSGSSGTLSPDLLVGSYPATPSISENVCSDIAISAAWARVSTADVNAWASLAESGETIQSFLSITGRIIRIANQLRKGNLREVWKVFTPRQLENHWMEGRYAVRPLVYDIHGVMSALQPIVRPERQTFRGSNSATAESSIVSSCWATSNYRLYGKFSTRRTILARAGVLAALEETSTIARWGLDQPVEALLEIIPFSFVAEWFCNVGKVIASWTPNLGLHALTSWVTVENTVQQTKGVDHVTDLATYFPDVVERKLSFTGGNCSTHTSTRTRHPFPGRPVVPHMSVRLDAAKLLDLAIMAKRLLS